MNIEELFRKYPWRTLSKFIPLAKRYGFSEEEARKFINEKAPKDGKIPKPKFILWMVSLEVNTLLNQLMEVLISTLRIDLLNVIIVIQ